MLSEELSLNGRLDHGASGPCAVARGLCSPAPLAPKRLVKPTLRLLVTACMGRSFYDLLQTISVLSFQPTPATCTNVGGRRATASPDLRYPNAGRVSASASATYEGVTSPRDVYGSGGSTEARATHERRSSVWMLPAGATPAAGDVDALCHISAVLSRHFERGTDGAIRHRQASETTAADLRPRSPSPAADRSRRSQRPQPRKLSPLAPLADVDRLDTLVPTCRTSHSLGSLRYLPSRASGLRGRTENSATASNERSLSA